MSGTLLFATLIGLAQPAPTNPDAMQWEELDEPEPEDAPAPAPAPEDAAPAPAPEDAASAPEATAPPPEEAGTETPTPEDAAPPAAEPAPEQPPTEEPAEPETAVEFTPPPPPEEELSTLQPPAGDNRGRRRRESLYGKLWAGPVIGGGRNAFAIGASATYFVVPWVGVGAELVNVFNWDPAGGFYEFQFTPQVTLLMLPRLRFSPVAWGGFGVDTFNKDLGTYGRWTGGGGFIMLLGRSLILTLGVDIDGRVPQSRWNKTFTCGPIRSNCTVGIGPVIGISIPFG